MNYGRTSLRRRAKQLDARGTRIRHKIGVILSKLLLIGIIVGGCAAVSFGVGAFKGILASAPDISEVDDIPRKCLRQTEVRRPSWWQQGPTDNM